MAKAERARSAALQVHLGDLPHAGDVRPEHVFHRAKQLHAALPGSGQNAGHDVQVSVIGSAGLLQHRVAVELGMRYGVVAAVEGLLVGFLRAMVRKDLTRNLAPCQTSPVGERGQVHRVNGPPFLQ